MVSNPLIPGDILIAVMVIGTIALFWLTPEARITRFVTWLLRLARRLFQPRRWQGFFYEFGPQTPPLSLRTLTKLVGTWTTATFVAAGGRGAANHIVDEGKELVELMDELHAKGEISPEDKYKLGLELADILILAIDIAYAKGIDLGDAVLLKHLINTQRKWSPPDERGVQHHIEPGVKGDINRTEAELARLKADWKYGADKLAAVIAKPDPTIAAAMAELLDANEHLEGFES